MQFLMTAHFSRSEQMKRIGKRAAAPESTGQAHAPNDGSKRPITAAHKFGSIGGSDETAGFNKSENAFVSILLVAMPIAPCLDS